MNIYDDKQVARDIIMDHYQNPSHKHEVTDDSYHGKHMSSASCIDDITVYLKTDENDKIVDIAFNGVGCTISTASTSILCDLVMNKTKQEALTLIHEYMNMLNEKPYDSDALQEANVFKDVSKSANRIKCATIGWRALSALLGEEIDE